MGKYLFLTIFCAFIGVLANASEPAKKSEKVYVLQGSDSPVRIEKADSVEKEELVMRDPNMAGDAKAVKKIAPIEKHSLKIVSKPSKKSVAKKPASQFKPMKVSATVRLPRVAFSKISLPVGLREESKSNDFVDRSLDQLP